MKSKKIIELIDITIKSKSVIFGQKITVETSKKIIDALIGDLPAFSKTTNKVVNYCIKKYNY